MLVYKCVCVMSRVGEYVYVREEGGLTDLPQCIYTRERERGGRRQRRTEDTTDIQDRHRCLSSLLSFLRHSVLLCCVCVCVCVCIMCMSILMWTVDSTVDSVGNKCTVDCRWWGLQFTVGFKWTGL